MDDYSDQMQNYFKYLESVLGFKTIQLKKIKLLIGVENLKSYTESEKDLLAKMIAALQMKPEDFSICDVREKEEFQSLISLFLIDTILEPVEQNQFILQTYSPRTLLNKPDLKKVAWVELQKIIHFFQQNPGQKS